MSTKYEVSHLNISENVYNKLLSIEDKICMKRHAYEIYFIYIERFNYIERYQYTLLCARQFVRTYAMSVSVLCIVTISTLQLFYIS